MHKRFFCILIALSIGYSLFAQYDLKDFANLKDVSFIPKQSNDTGIYYSYKGAWFGFSLPKATDTANLGSFGGPYNIYTQEWISDKLFAGGIEIKGKGKINLATAKNINIMQIPGALLQEYIFPNYKYSQRLTNVSSKTYICVSEFVNLSKNDILVNMSYQGRLFEKVAEGKELKNGWAIDLKDDSTGFFIIQFRVEGNLDLSYNEKEYGLKYKNYVTLKPQESLRLVATISHYFPGDSRDDIKLVGDALNDYEKPFTDNNNYWNYYISRLKNKNEKFVKLGISALETLWQNYKVQSTTFNNLWFTRNNSTPLWKLTLNDIYATSICLSILEPKLAANQISGFFHWFSDSTKKRLYNEYYFKENKSKEHSYSDFNIFPWLAWNAYSVDKSIPLLDNTIAEFQNINDYSYQNQDDNSNWFCESNNIETVKKNASLFSEILAIKKILIELKLDNGLDNCNKKITYLTQNFDKYFYDEFSNNYCDIDYHSNKLFPRKNVFPYVIWSGLGAFNSVEKYINTNYLNYQVNEDNLIFFEQEQLLSSFFLLSGLYNYKYYELLREIKEKHLQKIENEISKNDYIYFSYDNGEKITNSTFAAEMTLILYLYF